MKVLFIGGTGNISSSASRLAIARGIELYVLTRGESSLRGFPEGAIPLRADITDSSSVATALRGITFDAVVDWIAFTADDVRRDIELFRDRTSQYVFISSASIYAPPRRLPILESSPVRNPRWRYAQDKIAAEEVLQHAFREQALPITIVRPSHTYSEVRVPLGFGAWTIVERMRQGRPVVVPGDGTSLWTLTHADDFAPGLVGLLGNPRSIGETYHITSDEALSWDDIFRTVGAAAGADPQLVHVPSEAIASVDASWGDALLGDMSYSKMFDNSKIRSAVPDFAPRIPFSDGARQLVAWRDAEAGRRVVDARADALMDELVERFGL